MKISDHALIRYMERVKGVKLDHFRREIENLITDYGDKPESSPAGGEYCKDLTFVVEDVVGEPVVVTVLEPAFRPNRNAGDMRRLISVPIDDPVVGSRVV